MDNTIETAVEAVAALEGKPKPPSVKKWESEAIGKFLLPLYCNQTISARNNWLVSKVIIRQEFEKYLKSEENAQLRSKFEALLGKCDIGALLFRTKFLINTPRGSDVYRIKCSALFQYCNQKLDECDERQKKDSSRSVYYWNADEPVEKSSSDTPAVDPALEASLQIDPNASLYPLTYEGSQVQERDKAFQLTNMGCYICQCNFETPYKFEDHVEKHGDESDFELKNELKKFCTPAFTLSYGVCKDSHYFGFVMSTFLKDLVIEKIILVQTRSFYYVKNTHVPYRMPPSGQDNFFVDSHMFRKLVEQPIIIVFHDKAKPNQRMFEQHHFMRIEEFPKVHLHLNPNHLSSKKLFKPSIPLPQYTPTAEIRTAAKDGDIQSHLCAMSNEFKVYLENDKQLTRYNFVPVLRLLLQIEDWDTMREYFGLVQRNVTLRKVEKEYILKLKNPKNLTIENIIFPYDEVIIIKEDEVTLPQSLEKLVEKVDELIANKACENWSSNKKKKTTYYGQVERVSNGRVTFTCDRSSIPEELSYTILFRPTRLTLRYQYRALEQLDALDRGVVSRFLFPHIQYNAIPPLFDKYFGSFQLRLKSPLKLFNENIRENPEQYSAVQNIISDAGTMAPYIIFGPPGTGKTTTIVEAILQVYQIQSNSRILIMAGSNSACDEVALRICKILPSLNEPHIIARIYSRAHEKCSDNIDELLLDNSNLYNAHFYPDVEVLHNYRIVVCTFSVAGRLAMGKFGKSATGESIFTHVFVDEVAASTETEALVGILTTLSNTTNLIISGDHKQLGPILNSSRSADMGLGISLMERLMSRECYRVSSGGSYNRMIQTRLCRNFRSHPAIVQIYNQLYYDNELKAVCTEDVNYICKNWHRSPRADYPIIFYSVNGYAERDLKSTSWYNPLELQIVMNFVKDLMYFGVNGRRIKQSDIGIISPYKKQYLRIQDELNLRHWYQIEVGAVETFQGKEKEIIIVSFVRSNTNSLGFLENPRRINVTLSRPKSLLLLIGNAPTLSKNNDLKYVIDQCREHNTFIGHAETGEVANLNNQLKKLGKSMEKLNIYKENLANADEDKAQPKKKWKKKTTAAKKNNVAGGIKADVSEVATNKNAATKFKPTKPTSNEKQRQYFNMYKAICEKRSEIDELFHELPKPPPTNSPTKRQQATDFQSIDRELRERFENLNMRGPRNGANTSFDRTNDDNNKLTSVPQPAPRFTNVATTSVNRRQPIEPIAVNRPPIRATPMSYNGMNTLNREHIHDQPIRANYHENHFNPPRTTVPSYRYEYGQQFRLPEKQKKSECIIL